VDRGVVEAARGMGFTPAAVLTRVELPMALPLLFAGIRIAAIQIVATAALAAAVGAGGLGVLILSGLANSNDQVLLAGAIPTALLALGIGGLLAVLQRLLTPRGLRLAARRGPRAAPRTPRSAA
jgi:osmoprotectant transport system permease protein